jgi:hypothetical protein
MTAMGRRCDQTTSRFTAKRLRAESRLQRAEAGTVTEMARSLLRDARETGGGEARRRHDGARLHRIEPAPSAGPVPRAA